MIDLIQFLLAVTSTTSVSGKHLSVVTEFQVRIEMIVGSFIGAGIMISYYASKYKSGNWNSGDAKNVGYVFVGLLFFVVAMLII